MNDDCQKRALSAYEAMHALAEQDRDEFLTSLRNENPEAFAEVMSLVRHDSHASAVGFLAHPRVDARTGIDTAAQNFTRIGPYRIIREIGRGGMGVVYEAVQVEPPINKSVALKLVATHSRGDLAFRDRFLREAELAGELHHTNIVPVHFAGEHEGMLYYVMQLIVGQSLDHAIPSRGSDTRSYDSFRATASPADTNAVAARSAEDDSLARVAVGEPATSFRMPEFGTHDYFAWVAHVGIQAAEALAYAHERNIVHRDIKPSNLIIDDRDVVWITDFGLARRLDGPDVSRASGIMGSPRYMSPEQLSGGAVDHRTDIYSLGVSIYELVTHAPMFDNTSVGKVMRDIEHLEPVRPRQRNPQIPRDLETIILKSIAKQPSDRYATAAELAEDAKRWLKGLPILARRIGLIGRAVRWSRREPKFAVALACVLMGFIASIWQWRQAVVALNKADESAILASDERQKAEDSAERESAARLSAEKALYGSLLNEVRSLRLTRRQGWRTDALSKLTQASELRSKSIGLQQIRSEAILTAIGTDVTQSGTLPGHTGGHSVVWSMSFSSDGRQLASVDEAGNLRLWDVAGRKSLGLIPSAQSSPAMYSVNYHPVDGTMAFSGRPGKIDQLSSGSVSNVSADSLSVPGSVRSLSFSQDGAVLGVGCNEGIAQFFDWKERKLLRQIEIEGRQDFAPVAVSPDGTQMAFVGDGHAVHIGWIDASKPSILLGRHRKKVRSLAFSPDGALLAAASDDNRATLWSVSDGQEHARLSGHTAAVSSICFSSDGLMVATASDDTSVRLWDAQSGESVLLLEPNMGPITSVAFSRDGKNLAVGFRKIQLYDVSRVAAEHTITDRLANVTTVNFHPSNDVLLTGCGDHIEFWDYRKLRSVAYWKHSFGKYVACVAVSPKGDFGALGVNGYRDSKAKSFGVYMLPLSAPGSFRTLQAIRSDTRSLRFDPSGNWLVGVFFDGSCSVWRTIDDQPTATWRLQAPIVDAGFLDEGNRLVYADQAGEVVVRSTLDQSILAKVSLGTSIERIAVSPDRELLAVGCSNGDLFFLSTRDLGVRMKVAQAHQGEIRAIAFGGDGRLVAVGSTDRRITLWDTVQREQICSLPVDVSEIGNLAFDMNGIVLAVCGSSHLVTVLDLAMVNCELDRIMPAWRIAHLDSNREVALRPKLSLPANPFEAHAKEAVEQREAIVQLQELEQQERWSDALALAKRILQKYPDFKEAFNSIGRSLAELGAHELAIESFQKHLTLCPDCPAALVGMAAIYLRFHYFDRAAECMQPFAERKDVNPNLANSYVNVMLSGGRYDEAARFLEQIASSKANKSWISGRLAYTANLAGKQKESQEFLEGAKKQYLESNPNGTDGSTELLHAFELLCLGRHDESFQLAANWIEADPDSPAALVQAGRIFALSIVHSAIDSDPAERQVLIGQHRKRALELLESAMKAGFPTSDLRNHPDFEPLRNHPRFQLLMKHPKAN